MHAHVLVPFLEAVVFADVVQVVPADDDGALHLHLEYDTSQNSSADRHVSGEGALPVDVRALDRLENHNNDVLAI